jgi:outer membrane biogenesis lipoprotein LolB
MVMIIRHFAVLLCVCAVLAGCTPTPPPPVQKQAAQDQATPSPKNKDYSQPHTGW